METRIQAVKVTKVLHSGHTFKNIRKFPPGVLPTNREVICLVLNEKKFYSMKLLIQWQKNLFRCEFGAMSTPIA